MVMPSQAITRTDLSSTFSEFDERMDRRKFIGPRVFRPRVVAIQSADVGKVPIEALLRTPPDTRAPGGGYRRDDIEFDKFSYATEGRGRERTLDDEQLAIYRDMIDAEQLAARAVEDIVLRNYEIAVAAAVYNTTTWTGAALTTAITNEMDDHENATPIDVVEAARQKVIDGTGLVPNALICNRKQAWHMRQTAQIVDRLKYAGFDNPRNFTIQALAECLDLDFVLVAGGLDNTANEGQAASISQIWSDEYMMVARVAVTDDPQEPCIGRTFLWDGDGPGAPGTDEELAVIVEEYREEAVRGGVIRARLNRDLVVMYAAAGHLLSNAITIA